MMRRERKRERKEYAIKKECMRERKRVSMIVYARTQKRWCRCMNVCVCMGVYVGVCMGVYVGVCM